MEAMHFNKRFKVAIYSYPLLDPDLADGNYYEYLGLDQPADHAFASPVYIHIPFCDVVCPFCLYAKKNPDRQRNSIREYIDLLKQEIAVVGQSPYVQSLKINSIFVGGGTPSALSGSQTAEILEQCYQSLPLDHKTEITWECNAINCDIDKLRDIRAAGVTRVSTGVQTFKPEYRKLLGLAPTNEDVLRWLHDCETVGFDGISIDLMTALPGQTMDEWLADIKYTLTLAMINHLSLYELVPIAGTPLYKMVEEGRVPAQPSLAMQDEMHFHALELLTAAGYRQQTLNEFDKKLPGSQFWDQVYDGYGDNLAFGVSSFGHINGISYQNYNSIDEYKAQLDDGELPIELVSAQANRTQSMERAAALSIMLSQIDKGLFARQFGQSFDSVFGDLVAGLEAGGYVTSDADWVRTTHNGQPWLRNMSVEFMRSTFAGVSHAQRLLSIGKRITPEKLLKYSGHQFSTIKKKAPTKKVTPVELTA